MQHTPNKSVSAKNMESGTNISLFFLISFGRFVNVNARSRAENTIQNQVRPLLIAKSHIKHGINAIAYEI